MIPKPKYKTQVQRRAKREREYLEARADYLEQHRRCEVCTIRLPLQIHHKAGRIGSLLTDPDNFLAVCVECHELIERQPEWAMENGFKESRL